MLNSYDVTHTPRTQKVPSYMSLAGSGLESLMKSINNYLSIYSAKIKWQLPYPSVCEFKLWLLLANCSTKTLPQSTVLQCLRECLPPPPSTNSEFSQIIFFKICSAVTLIFMRNESSSASWVSFHSFIGLSYYLKIQTIRLFIFVKIVLNGYLCSSDFAHFLHFYLPDKFPMWTCWKQGHSDSQDFLYLLTMCPSTMYPSIRSQTTAEHAPSPGGIVNTNFYYLN